MMKSEKDIQALFERISDTYDSANDRVSFFMHRIWKRRFAKNILKNLPQGAAVLDLCCGTGDVAIMLAKLRPDIMVTALDFSENMLKIARERAAGYPNIRFMHGDALNTGFAQNSFDACVISFGLRNIPDKNAALREMRRVSRAGVWCLESSTPENALVRWAYFLYFRKIMPLWGGGRKHFADYGWLQKSAESFLSKAELLEAFRAAGLDGCHFRQYFFGACAEHYGGLKDAAKDD